MKNDPLVPVWRKPKKGGKWLLDGHARRSEVQRRLRRLEEADEKAVTNGSYEKGSGWVFRAGEQKREVRRFEGREWEDV